MIPLAHSPRGGIPGQAYLEHIERVRRRAKENAEQATTYHEGESSSFISTVEAAAIYHDLGKLDEANQQVLCNESHDPLPVAHEDAGVAELLRLRHREAAVLVAAHHAGLFSQSAEISKQARAFRNRNVADHVDKNLERYVGLHETSGCPMPDSIDARQLNRCGFSRRVALSCLVDADHSDTARHYGNEVPYDPPQPKWQERLESLNCYVAALPARNTPGEQPRNHLRCRVYEACREAPIQPALRSCDAPVGSGKTTAVMAHLLRVAQEKSPRLRHIFVVLPYTNIITQAVDVYREALVLPGERPEDVVAEHHHQADFEDVSLRQLATLWRAPIIVTTAVQFFETLASHHPASLRKLHELPGSAVFVDETHAAMPSHLWPQVWRWLETWTQDWGGHIVLASGSLPRFWELEEFVSPPKATDDVPDLVPNSLRHELEVAESRRIIPRRKIDPYDCEQLIKSVGESKGPRLAILNTVQSAAIVADQMRKTGHDVLHLSTALAPAHRNRIVEVIKERLKGDDNDWTLVATSCVEAGMDFSFRIGFRESCSIASLIQTGGRVNRHAEESQATVWDFRLLDSMLSQHPNFTLSRRVLDKLFNDGVIEKLAPHELAKEAMRREVTEGGQNKAKDICVAEDEMEYPEVAALCRVIDTDTRIVVIDPLLVKALRDGERVGYRELLQYSVQIWASKIDKLPVAPVLENRTRRYDSNTLYEWKAEYDADFLGYMSGLMPLLEGLQQGSFIA
ncbi:MAG TPA: DEAD/DEAH box helicase [Nitrospira sp.]|nr:DEAD/DEAH box helicase [Nitrospira sp.]